MSDLPSKRTAKGKRIAAAEKMNRVKALNAARSTKPLTADEIDTLRLKVSPLRLRVSPKFHAMLGYLLQVKGWTRPDIGSMVVTSDGFIIADGGFLGAVSDLRDNIVGMQRENIITGREATYLLCRVPTFRLG